MDIENQDEIKEQWHMDKRFEPTMEAETSEELYAGWKKQLKQQKLSNNHKQCYNGDKLIFGRRFGETTTRYRGEIYSGVCGLFRYQKEELP